MVAKEHEHRNEDRSEDGPLGRAARNKDVDEGRNEDKGDAHGKARKADSSEEVSTGNRHERAQMGPVEKSLELAAEKAENNVGAHAAHLLDHGFVDVLDRFKAARRDAIRDAGNTEEEKRIGMRPLRSNDPTRVCPSLERTPAKKPMARMAI